MLNSKKQNSSLPLVQAGCLEIEERKKEIFLFSVADQNFKGAEGMLMQLGKGWAYLVFTAFQNPWQHSGNTYATNTSSYRKKNLLSFYSMILSVYLLRFYQSLNYQVL